MAWIWLPSLTVAAAAAFLPAPAEAQAGRVIFCCEDAQEQSICADTLPPACYGRAYREISPRGLVVRHVAAPLTVEEQARLEAENRRRARQEALERQQRNMDNALLETYRGLNDIDMREALALEDVERSIADIHERRRGLMAERRALEEEIAALPADQDVEPLNRSLRAVDSELRSYQRLLEAKQAERESIQARYAADRRRYAELIAERAQR
ncbi:hypothetical protein [Pseudazoarcus pumilus]|uniref:DUF4124 domain-containing protein n=1 Tax=Pseudazoarcus pumilus TaxID=2067960 RepID=A0A2I6S9K1_9RHOO|nr:hypothetical protein [Pseudazoarcus pumilus]AUN95932.1 hypothetical protein C0099_13905 [Pseudazoarcus pumilus]